METRFIYSESRGIIWRWK